MGLVLVVKPLEVYRRKMKNNDATDLSLKVVIYYDAFMSLPSTALDYYLSGCVAFITYHTLLVTY
jgi:hypothetical protein